MVEISVEELNEVANKVFDDLQKRLKVNLLRPVIVTKQKDFEQEIGNIKKALGTSREFVHASTAIQRDGVPHGLMGRMVHYDRNNVDLVLGPLKVHGMPKHLSLPLLQHEYGHLISCSSDPVYNITIAEFVGATLISTKGFIGIISRLVYPQRVRERYAHFAKIFDESLCWIAPAQLSGIEAVQGHFELSSKIARSDNYLNWYTHNTGATLHKKLGYDLNALVNPMSIMNERHPLIADLDYRKEMQRFQDEYRHNRSRYVFNVHVWTKDGLEKVKSF